MIEESAFINSVLNGLFGKAMSFADLSTGTVFSLHYSLRGNVKYACLEVLRTRLGDYSGQSRTYMQSLSGPGQPLRSAVAVVRQMVLEALQNFDL